MKTLKERGIDQDLCEGMMHDYSSKRPYQVKDIDQVLAVLEISYSDDSARYIWLVRLECGDYGLIDGGYTTYTGWSYSGELDTIAAPTSKSVLDLGVELHNITSREADDLQEQLNNGKWQTWQQQTAKEFGREGDVDDVYGWMLE